MAKWLWVAALMLLCVGTSLGKETKGVVTSNKPFLFLERFCFSAGVRGTLNFSFYTPPGTDLTNLKFQLFRDDSGMPTWYFDSPATQCESARRSNSHSFLIGGKLPPGNVIFFSSVSRPYYWFFALNNCPLSGINASTPTPEYVVQYNLTMLQPTRDINRQFSFDDQGLWEVYLALTVVFFVVVLLNAFADWRLYKASSFHPIARILTVVVWFLQTSHFCYMVHYSAYINNGVGVPFLAACGLFFNLASEVLFMFLLLVLAKGWGIATPRLEWRWLMFAALAIFGVVYVAMFAYYIAVTGDPIRGTYVYLTPPGYAVLVVRLIALLFFVLCCTTTLRLESSIQRIRAFYSFLGIYMMYFLSLFGYVVIAALAPLWIRAVTVGVISSILQAVFVTIIAVAFAFLQPVHPQREENGTDLSASVSRAGSTSPSQARAEWTTMSARDPEFIQGAASSRS